MRLLSSVAKNIWRNLQTGMIACMNQADTMQLVQKLRWGSLIKSSVHVNRQSSEL